MLNSKMLKGMKGDTVIVNASILFNLPMEMPIPLMIVYFEFGGFHNPFWFAMYLLTVSNDTAPTVAQKYEFVQRLGKRRLRTGNSS